jgi:hypothetical protein
MTTPANIDNKFKECISDVVIRHHEHNQYKTEKDAVKALSRRYPGLTDTEYRAAFEFYSRLLAATISSLTVFLESSHYIPLNKYASPEDIDTEILLQQLQGELPNESATVLGTFISWVIFWHYLK